MIGDNTSGTREVGLVVCCNACFSSSVKHELDKRRKQISLKNGTLLLQRHGKAFKANANVNTFLLQRHEFFVSAMTGVSCRLGVIFIKHKVPNFDAVDIKLGGGATGSFVARRSPEIICAATSLNLLLGKSERLPDSV